MKAVHFSLEELVDKDTFGTYGEKAWEFLHPDAIVCLDGIRDFFGLPVTVNNWHTGGAFQYRGYRPPHCTVGAPGSYHRRGMAFDLDVKGLDAMTVRDMIIESKDDPLIHGIQRMEAGVQWVHFDIMPVSNRIYLFKA